MSGLMPWERAADEFGVDHDEMLSWLRTGRLASYAVSGKIMVKRSSVRAVCGGAMPTDLDGAPVLPRGPAARARRKQLAAGTANRGRRDAVTTMVTTAERLAIDAAAEASGVSRAAWLRQIALHAAGYEPAQPPPAPGPDDPTAAG